MRFVNEVRTTELRGPDGSTIVLSEHVRGVDARAEMRGVLFEHHRPVAVEWSGRGLAERHAVPQEGLASRIAPFLVAPMVALALSRLMRKGRD